MTKAKAPAPAVTDEPAAQEEAAGGAAGSAGTEASEIGGQQGEKTQLWLPSKNPAEGDAKDASTTTADASEKPATGTEPSSDAEPVGEAQVSHEAAKQSLPLMPRSRRRRSPILKQSRQSLHT